ncbi:MAG: hypothetical protein O9320_08700 [Magnetospirillum sp.]|nr:hypothetical protein [Magnetospirillum sp.]
MARAGLTPTAIVEAFELLARPFGYLRIRHRAKWAVDIWFPAAAAVVMTALYVFSPAPPGILGDGGLLKEMRDVIAIMVAFYVAALTAIVSIQSPFLDAAMDGKTPPRMPRTYHGHTTWEIPIRRQFLGALLGYLVCVQILVIVASFGIRFVAPLAVAALPDVWLLVSKAFVVFICVFAFAQVSLGTMIVVHYLGSRLNSPQRAAPQD